MGFDFCILIKIYTMSHYQCISIAVTDEAVKDLLVAELADAGYEGFEESAETLKAYIPGIAFKQNMLDEILRKYDLTYSKSIIEKQNWNALWESNFEPVQVEDFVGVRAGFHPPFEKVQHEIVITPKMSFGTGHHATTYMMMMLMKEIVFDQKTVFDFGTGTGILAILADKLGAGSVLAADNDDWCIENATENISINHSQNIVIQKVDTAEVNKKFDIIIANINKNIILDNLGFLAAGTRDGGDILLSGLLQDDEADILEACGAIGWKHWKTISRAGWIACRFGV